MSGWGACAGDNVVGGHWADSENEHINILELKAVLLGLKTLFPNVIHKHIRIKSDNTTVVASINNCGSIKRRLLDVTEEVFEWAHHRNVTLSAEYLQGSLNVTADLASREKFSIKNGVLCLQFSMTFAGFLEYQLLIFLPRALILNYRFSIPGNLFLTP